MHPHSVASLFESQWSTLQMVVLREILMSAVRAGDPLTAWSAAARLLRSYFPLITPAGQNGLASALTTSVDRLPSGTRCADPALPFLRLVFGGGFRFQIGANQYDQLHEERQQMEDKLREERQQMDEKLREERQQMAEKFEERMQMERQQRLQLEQKFDVLMGFMKFGQPPGA